MHYHLQGVYVCVGVCIERVHTPVDILEYTAIAIAIAIDRHSKRHYYSHPKLHTWTYINTHTNTHLVISRNLANIKALARYQMGRAQYTNEHRPKYTLTRTRYCIYLHTHTHTPPDCQ